MKLLTLLVLPAAATTVSLAAGANAGTFNLTVGDPFTVEVRVADAPALYSFQFDLGFDPLLVQLDDVLEGSFLNTGGAATSFIPGTIDNGAGTLLFTANSLLGPGPGVSGDGVLARLRFNTNAAGQTVLALGNVVLLDAALNEIDAVSADGTVNITLPGRVPEPPSVALAGLALLLAWGCASRRPTVGSCALSARQGR